MKTILWMSAGLILSNAAGTTHGQSAADLHFFETQVRPLLHTRCVKCHGEAQQKGGLRLDSREDLLRGGESGPAAVSGQPEESLLLEAVRYESFEMPPDRKLKDSQIDVLRQWIQRGLPWPVLEGVSVRLTGAAFSDEERNFWSLQPIVHPTPPAIPDWGLNEVDAFIGAKLSEAGIRPAPPAEHMVLLRRLYFDVVGVPPDVAQLRQLSESFSDRSSGTESQITWPRLIDQLLNDPRYGEHWARHWLDVVRYAESDGFRADFYRPDAWRYRDYVVNAFNNDKPYDEFVRQQIAGDEIAPDNAESLIATGYLRTFLYEYNQRDARTQWQDILNQVTDVTGEVFLGMGVGCARCHDHKFDPILQEDYFRLQACFGTMLPRDDVPAADVPQRRQFELARRTWLAKAADLRDELDRVRGPYMTKAAEGAIKRFPDDIQAIMAMAPSTRNPLESQLADLVNRQILFDQERAKISDEDKKQIEELEKRILELAGKPPAELPTAITVADVGPTPQVLHIGADHSRKAVSAGGFSILNPDAFTLESGEHSTGQRTALADWLTDRQQPLTARVIVNRIWQQHFGTGLVNTASDFGTLGGRPSHPELLDWLAAEFMNHNWSIKWLHRTILNSATWQMSAHHPQPTQAESADPGNRLRWRFAIRRLTAEQIRDSMLTVSHELKNQQGGPSVDYDSLRRSLYLKAMRNTPEPLLRSLDGVDGLNSVSRRSTTTTPTQALNLINGDWVRARSVALARRILKDSDRRDLRDIVDGMFLTTLGRLPTAAELPVALDFLDNNQSQNDDQHRNRLFASISDATGPAVAIGDDSLPALSAGDDSPVMQLPMTICGIFQLESLFADAKVRTVISQWNSSTSARGWSLGVTSTKSGFKPRNFILQVVGDRGYEVVASDLRPELHTAYLAAVVIEAADPPPAKEDGKANNAQARFYLQPLTKEGVLQQAVVPFRSAAAIDGGFPIVIGGRTQQKTHNWHGCLDQLALFDTALPENSVQALFDARLSTDAVLPLSPVAFWNFADLKKPGTDRSGKNHDLQTDEFQQRDPLEVAVTEFCHVLLNSNEFVYVD